MKKFFTLLSTAAFLASIGPLYADEAKGKVQSVDPTAKSITLDDGTTYSVADDVAIETLQPDAEVTITYEERDGQKTATSVTSSQ